MDELMDRRLRDQERSLRAVMGAFQRADRQAAALGSSSGWRGPASAAYDAAIATLRSELYAAEAHLGAALRHTVNAISSAPTRAEESCGG